MEEITLNQALDEYKEIYMAYRNFADRTRVEYINDLDGLIGFLERVRVNKVGNLRLAPIERYLAELANRGYADVTRKRKL